MSAAPPSARPSRPRQGSLYTKIIGWSFVPTAIILIAVAWVTYYAYQRVTEDLVVERNRELARLSAGQLATGLREYADPLDSLARVADIYEGDPLAQAAALQRARNRLVAFDAGVVVLDHLGRVVAVAPDRPEILGQDWSGRAYFRQMIHTPGPAFSDVVADGPEGDSVVVVAAPIIGPQGEFVGALAGMYRLGATAISPFYAGILRLRLGESGALYLVDGQGMVIYHSDAGRVGQSFADHLVVQRVLAGQIGNLRTRDLDGEDLLTSFAPIPGTSWGLISEEKWSMLMAPSQGYRRFLLILLALGVIVPAIVVTVGVGRIMRPINEMIRAAQAVAAGRFGQTIAAQTDDELEELATQFNRMSARLQESYATLERKVADRTRELATLNAIAMVVSRSLDLRDVLQDALAKTLEAMGMEGGSAFRIDGVRDRQAGGATLTLMAQQGLSAEVVEQLADGRVDIVIGTHRLLSKDVRFHDLGLLIVDEEHRFGVAHKERIKQLKETVDVLTLTATPIPRTLQMALSGLRDLSAIQDPPEGRLAVRTYLLEWDPTIVREAILRELDRGGQVYYVHNRIETIHREAERLQKLVPQASLRVGHGRMSPDELEEVMLDFYDHQFDVLVCTTIIESGIDIPNVNTIIVTDADRLGLAQLHQLRGRVGRSSRQAYCYLTYPPFKQLTEAAEKRLDALRDFTDLGAGFQLALRDLEIRGAGNLLGAEQHGFIAAVGFDLYCQMIDEAVRELRGQPHEEPLLPSVNLPVSAFLPADYVPTDGMRLAFYRRIAACRTPDAVDAVQRELEDRFGDPPAPVWNLLALMRLRMRCVPAGVGRIEADRQGITFWMARRLSQHERVALHRRFRRATFLPDRIVLYYEGENHLRAAENFVEALQAGGGEQAAAAVRRQLAAANLAEQTAPARP